jgi:signal transduction histidine kinase
MFDSMQSILLGAAAVFDTVLLLVLLERRNWPFVRWPIVAMTGGLWLWHVSQFALVLLSELPGRWPWRLQSLCMLGMAVGLLLMPCGLLHGAWRVCRHQLEAVPRWQPRHLLAYVPMLALIPLAPRFFHADRGDFVTITESLELPYLLFSKTADLLAAGCFFWAGRNLTLPLARPFFRAMACVLLGMTLFHLFVFLVAKPLWPGGESYWMLAATLSPIAPALLFAYFVVRFHFLHIILERTLVYGAILGGLILLHQLAWQDVSAAVPESNRIHVLLLEMALLTALIVCYQPLRQRTAEGLRYFLGVRMSATRERLRQLSSELAAQAGRFPDEILRWFIPHLQDALEVEYASGWLFNETDEIAFQQNETKTWSNEQALWLFQRMRAAGFNLASSRHVPDRELGRRLQEASASLALLKIRPNVAGLLILGQGRRHRNLSEEETNAALLLVEQLAITLDNSLLQAQSLAAERKALQAEKLTALGLLASSIAHEVKNPLSAIKTIAAVMAEDLGPESPHAEDLRLILGEVDRLAGTTAQLLEIARPRAGLRAPASLVEALSGTLRLLRHLANQQGISIEATLAEDLPLVQADEQTLREIFFNLLSNALQAAGQGGRIQIHCHRENGYVVAQVCDNGPGIPDEIRVRLFEPFLTTKQTGTGLGLYIVGRRVGELGGIIRCDGGLGQGTSFTVKLPCEEKT